MSDRIDVIRFDRIFLIYYRAIDLVESIIATFWNGNGTRYGQVNTHDNNSPFNSPSRPAFVLRLRISSQSFVISWSHGASSFFSPRNAGEGVSVGSVTVGAKETGCHQFRAWATKRNVDRETALESDDIRASFLVNVQLLAF